ncbi:MAG: hypothetical protein M5R36_19775 [Deltaproteobacteria bacterium]|nr:hypothetical protein [Deltaproteobacteria bacterium]
MELFGRFNTDEITNFQIVFEATDNPDGLVIVPATNFTTERITIDVPNPFPGSLVYDVYIRAADDVIVLSNNFPFTYAEE